MQSGKTIAIQFSQVFFAFTKLVTAKLRFILLVTDFESLNAFTRYLINYDTSFIRLIDNSTLMHSLIHFKCLK